ncbi:hypothetical protein D3C76_1542960 [compost metagenome]
MRVAITQVGGEETADFRHMHPGQQVGVAGCVGAAVRGGAGDLKVNGAHLVDQPLGIAGGAEGGTGNELAGAAQAAEQVFTEV